MTIWVKCIAGISLFLFTFAAYMGFVNIKDKNDRMNRIKLWIDNTFKYRWLQKPYILTRIALGLGFTLGIWGIVISQ